MDILEMDRMMPQKNWGDFHLIDSCFELGGVEPGKSSYQIQIVVKLLGVSLEFQTMCQAN